MRQGVNPEKFKGEKNKKKLHRIVVVFYIPNTIDEYYKECKKVLEVSLNSLVNTINFDTTAITLINNNSDVEVNDLICKFVEKGQIDKYVCYSENMGKVYAVMNEVRAIYEPFVTISDADILFVKGWEKEVFSIYKSFKWAGVVAPLPCSNLAFNHNNSVFFDSFLSFSLKRAKKVSDKDCDFYLEGLGNDSMLNRNNRNFDWRSHQYYLENGSTSAILGAGHFVATYRTELLNKCNVFPEFKFFNGYEDKFIDDKADYKGYYRLSSPKSFAYHIGNKVDHNIDELNKIEGDSFDFIDFAGIEININRRFSSFWIREFTFKVVKKVFKL